MTAHGWVGVDHHCQVNSRWARFDFEMIVVNYDEVNSGLSSLVAKDGCVASRRHSIPTPRTSCSADPRRHGNRCFAVRSYQQHADASSTWNLWSARIGAPQPSWSRGPTREDHIVCGAGLERYRSPRVPTHIANSERRRHRVFIRRHSHLVASRAGTRGTSSRADPFAFLVADISQWLLNGRCVVEIRVQA